MGKFFKTANPNSKLEAAITSRIGMEGARDPKTIKVVGHYNTVKSVPFVGPRVKAEVLSRVKKKHGKFIKQEFGNVSNKKFNSLAETSIKKITMPNIRQVHTRDSLALVNSGQKYPTSVNNYFAHLRAKQRKNRH